VSKTMQVDKSKRYGSMEELRSALVTSTQKLE
jgi:hypothetical protein